MKPLPSDEELHQVLRSLPPLLAPPDFAARVRACIERQSRAWWLLPYGAWPLGPRLALPVLALAACVASVPVTTAAFAGLAELQPAWCGALGAALAAWAARLPADAVALARSVPQAWALGAAITLGVSMVASVLGVAVLRQLASVSNASSR